MTSAQSSGDKNQLTGEELKALLFWLDNDQATSARQYAIIHRKLIKFFEWRGCRSPEERADITLDRVAKKVAAGEKILTPHKFLYVHGVALNVLREYFKSKQPELMTAPEEIPASAVEQDPSSMIQNQETCLKTLADDERILLTEYYAQDASVKKLRRISLSKKYGLSENGLRIKIHRIREKLRECVRKMGDD